MLLVLLELCDSVSRCHPSFLFWSPSFWLPNFPLFALSPPALPPPCLSQLLCPLPDCCIPTLPSDSEGWVGVQVCVCLCYCALCWACTSYNFACLQQRTHLSAIIWGAGWGRIACILFVHMCKGSTRVEAESIRQRSHSSSLLTAQS